MFRREKLNVNEQVEHMASKGITFDIVSKVDAVKYLSSNNYYFKIKSYNKMFEKYNFGQNKGKYVNLDFAYLKEMAILDMHLRHFIIKTSIDLEHTIKVLFMRDFNSSKSDGYDIVDVFFERYPDAKQKILQKKNSSYCSGLIEKLESEGYALWNLIEIVSFGDFINLYRLFYEEFKETKQGIDFTYPMLSLKNLRNAAAHNNCILNQLTKEKTDNLHENRKIVTYISKVSSISKEHRRNCMKMQVVHDFVTLLYVLDKAVESKGVKNKIVEELNELINVRMVRNGEYFKKNNELKTIYNFIKKIVDTFLN